MKATKTMLGGGACALALFGGPPLFSAPASASSVSIAVYRSDSPGWAPSSYYQQVRRIFVAPAYAYDSYYDGPAYYGPPVAYGPPVNYAPPVAYEYAPPPAAYYGPGPGIAVAAPG